MKKSLVLGAGKSGTPETPDWEYVTLDINPDHNPDIVWDLNELPYTFAKDGEYDSIIAHQVLEHLGSQGDYQFFFAQFEEFYRILKPGGRVVGSVPDYQGEWAWGDPGHTRVFTPGTLVFLSQKEYVMQVGVTAMSDYRWCYKGNFEVVNCSMKGENMYFVLYKMPMP